MPDGHCPTSDEVIYSKYGPVCPGDGSVATPFCDAKMAIAALTMARHIVIMRGPQTDWRSYFAGAPVTVIGQQGGLVRPAGSNDGITITGGDIFIRNLDVATGFGNGIVARLGSTLRLYGCLIESNAGYGIETLGAAFDIENTVVAHNGGSTLAGVNLGSTTTTPTIFRNNTVVENGLGGVLCGAAYSIAGSIVFGNGTIQSSAPCVVADACGTACSTMNPMLDETVGRYQLTASSPTACIDVLATAPSTDRKGTPRPQGPKSDCGADEFIK
jgi:hypothetical protein